MDRRQDKQREGQTDAHEMTALAHQWAKNGTTTSCTEHTKFFYIEDEIEPEHNYGVTWSGSTDTYMHIFDSGFFHKALGFGGGFQI